MPRHTGVTVRDGIGWAATAATLAGVAVQSLAPSWLVYSFAVFLVGNALWFANGAATRNRPLMAIQVVAAALNVVAMIRRF